MRWLSASCFLALICACVSPQIFFAQTAPQASNTDGAKPNTRNSNTKNSNTKKTSSTKQSSTAAHSKSTSATAGHSKLRHSSARGKKRVRGQQKIDPVRAQAIQEALIREHYLSGMASGTWNQSSEDAMRRYQADHGWQSKTVPDSRALISLGLGPSHDHLLNPDSAMTTGPSAPRAVNLTPTAHSAKPVSSASPSSNSGQDGAGPQ